MKLRPLFEIPNTNPAHGQTDEKVEISIELKFSLKFDNFANLANHFNNFETS